ncbi:nitrilase-related carbon-nitrogen hydrolase [Yinghuangia seranimata]|uniref:nitrilase-related carbon-nitrogen hydrolase n=1 Tax=Yinghuangia seranimata TaxID=408067 RepID=UPI00248B2850|nr:nitrilase-related carbon-nitrogen hydrolase [Yinghuangia seranimata]MDI2132437.1 nitrilase-related carbon-nitrogen hydrolase [Yinghuangia seranimata]
MTDTPPPAPGPAYRAVALQTATHAVNALGVDEARAAIGASIDRIAAQIAAAVAWHGPDTALVVLPEYALTGFPMGDAIGAWADKAAIAPDGPEYERLAAVAQRHRIHLAVNAYETDPHYPDLYFQGCVVLGPTGETLLRYRRLHSMYTPSPYDVWDSYLDHYGLDGVLPVARTAIGNLAAVASEEILYPELLRALAFRGAEVFVHSTSEATSPDPTVKEYARRCRAAENLACVVTANSAGITGIPLSGDSTNGHSEIVDHLGRSLARAASGESLVAAAEIDLAAVRRERLRPSMANLPARVKSTLWAEEYARHPVDEPNGLKGVAPERAFFATRHRENIARAQAASRTGTP